MAMHGGRQAGAGSRHRPFFAVDAKRPSTSRFHRDRGPVPCGGCGTPRGTEIDVSASPGSFADRFAAALRAGSPVRAQVHHSLSKNVIPRPPTCIESIAAKTKAAGPIGPLTIAVMAYRDPVMCEARAGLRQCTAVAARRQFSRRRGRRPCCLSAAPGRSGPRRAHASAGVTCGSARQGFRHRTAGHSRSRRSPHRAGRP